MADKYVNQTGLTYFFNRLKTIFATKTETTAISDRIDGIVSTGGEPNIIESVKVNGSALTVTNKSVNVVVPTTVASLSDASSYATKQYVTDNGGKIDVIKVNNSALTISDKAVNITVPTAVSSLTNDSGFQTAAQVSSAIQSAMTSAYVYKGSVATVSALPNNAESGDVYDVQATGMNYAWNGTSWDALGQLIDTSTLWAVADLVAVTTSEIDTITADSGNS